MKWRLACVMSLEMAAWSFVPAFAIAVHQVVRLKFAFLLQHHLVLARVDERTLWARDLWQRVDEHYGGLFVAAVLIPVVCSFVQHLGMRWWWRVCIGIAICAPAVAYIRVALQLVGKVAAPSP